MAGVQTPGWVTSDPIPCPMSRPAFPIWRTHAWTRRQRWLIVAGVVATLAAFATAIGFYERHYRGPTDAVFVGTWEIGGCMDCTNLITFQPNHDVIVFGDYLGLENQLDYRGRWYAGGEQLIIRFHDDEGGGLIVMRIQAITPKVIRLRSGGMEMSLTRSQRTPPQASNAAAPSPPKAFATANLDFR